MAGCACLMVCIVMSGGAGVADDSPANDSTGYFTVQTGVLGDGRAFSAESFAIDYECTSGGTGGTTSGTITAVGDNRVYAGPPLPDGSTCVVKEREGAADRPGYDVYPIVHHGEFTIKAGETVPVIVTNHYTKQMSARSRQAGERLSFAVSVATVPAQTGQARTVRVDYECRGGATGRIEVATDGTPGRIYPAPGGAQDGDSCDFHERIEGAEFAVAGYDLNVAPASSQSITVTPGSNRVVFLNGYTAQAEEQPAPDASSQEASGPSAEAAESGGDSEPPSWPSSPALTFSRQSVRRGEEIIMVASGLMPGERAVFETGSDGVAILEAEADYEGRASATWTVPADLALGDHEVVVRGRSEIAGSFVVTEAAASESTRWPVPAAGSTVAIQSSGGGTASRTSSLARTGAPAGPGVVASVLLMSAGLITRRRGRIL